MALASVNSDTNGTIFWFTGNSLAANDIPQQRLPGIGNSICYCYALRLTDAGQHCAGWFVEWLFATERANYGDRGNCESADLTDHSGISRERRLA
jgi:hypothetical protein